MYIRPVERVNCQMPEAPTCERASGLKDDSTWGSEASSTGMPRSAKTPRM